MHLHTHGNQSQSTQGVHTLGYLEHGKITREVREGIEDDKNYIITDIPPNGDEVRSFYTGYDIKENYSQIFGAYLHGFLVHERNDDGSIGKIVFLYTGPIYKKVNEILGKNTYH